MADGFDDQQQLNYKVNVDRSDVYQAINDIEQRAQQSAQSVSAMSSNVLAQIAQLQASAQYAPQVNTSPMMQMNAMQSAMYANSTMPFSPQSMMAQSAYQQQIMAMGPAQNAYGPSMTTPFGTATINPFQSAGASAYRLPTMQMQQFGPPGQPGDPTRDRLLFGMGSGSMFNAARQSVWGMVTGRPGFGNDNLEDLMARNIERQQQYMSENVFNVGAGVASFGGSFAAGLPSEWAAGALARKMGLGTIAGIGARLGGGFAASTVFDSTYGYLENRERSYQEGAKDLREYTAPYIRGNRPGGGMTYKETLGMERDLAKQVGRDNFFNAEDYRTLINMAGETGMFQGIGSKDQAMKALDNMSKSVKTLYALGVKSRDHLQSIDMAFNQFGVSAAADPTKLANLFQTFAATAQSAGMSTAQMVQTVAPAAQAAMAQGLGPMAGAVMAAQNQGVAGGLFRSGALGGFDNAYFGGAQGFGNSLTQAQFAIMRSPMGSLLTSSMFAPGSHTLQDVLAGKPVGPMTAMNSMSGFAANPLGYIGLQARMPELTQDLGPQMQMASIQLYIQAFKQLAPGHVDKDGRINPNDFLGFLMSVEGLPSDQALAMVKFLGNAQGAATDTRRSARDQQINLRMEGLRHPSLTRAFEKAQEYYVDPFAVNAFTSGREMASDVVDAGARAVGSVFHRNVQDYQELVSGVRMADLGDSAYLLDPQQRMKAQGQQRELLKNLGYAQSLDIPTAAQQTRNNLSSAAMATLQQGGMLNSVAAGLKAAGIQPTADVMNYLKNGTGTPDEIQNVSKASDLFRTMRSSAYGNVGDTETRNAIDRVVLQQYRNMQEKEKNVISGYAAFDPADTNRGDAALASLVAADPNAAQKYLSNITSDMDPTTMRNTFMQNVANADSKYKGKTLDAIRADTTLGANLGTDAAAAIAGMRNAPNMRFDDGTLDKLDSNLKGLKADYRTGGAVTDIKDFTARLQNERTMGVEGSQNLKTGAYAVGVAAARTTVISALAGNIPGVIAGSAGLLAAGAILWGEHMYTNNSNSAGLNKILSGEPEKAGTALRIGSNAALLNAVNSTNSYQELVAKLSGTNGLKPDEIDRLLGAYGVTNAQSYNKAALVGTLGSQEKVDMKNLRATDPSMQNDVNSMLTDINAHPDDAASYAGRTFRSYENVMNFNAQTAYNLDDNQTALIHDKFNAMGSSAAGQAVIEQLNKGDLGSMRMAVATLEKNKMGSGAAFDAAKKLLNRDLAGTFNTDNDAQLIKDAGIDPEAFRKGNAAERLATLRGQVIEPFAGAHTTEQNTSIANTGILDAAAAMQQATAKQLEVANRYDAIARSFSKDNTQDIVDALKTMTGAIGKNAGASTDDTFNGAVVKFGAAVDGLLGFLRKPHSSKSPTVLTPQGKPVP